jgi:hypothetical protein
MGDGQPKKEIPALTEPQFLGHHPTGRAAACPFLGLGRLLYIGEIPEDFGERLASS